MEEKKDQFALIERTVMDEAFRSRLLDDPEGVIVSEGYLIPEDLMQQIRSMDRQALEEAVASLNHQAGGRIAAG